MPQFRKKPVVIEAVLVTYAEWDGSGWDGDPFSEEPEWIKPLTLKLSDDKKTYIGWEIKTLEGTMLALPGDWVIKGVAGEIYPCKPGIFEKTYDPV